MDWLFIIIVGGIIGFIASAITGSSQGLIADIIVGIIGSILGRLIFFDWLHIGSAAFSGSFNLVGIFWGVIGAIILIAIIRMVVR